MDQSNHPYIDVVLAALEVYASERPDTLPALVEIMRQSPAYAALAAVAGDWGAGHAGELAEVARKAAADLTRLESRAVRSLPVSALDAPTNLAALYDFAAQRAKRVSGQQRRRAKLKAIGGRLVREYSAVSARKSVERFLSTPPAPVDSAWLTWFLRRRPRTPSTAGKTGPTTGGHPG